LARRTARAVARAAPPARVPQARVAGTARPPVRSLSLQALALQTGCRRKATRGESALPTGDGARVCDARLRGDNAPLTWCRRAAARLPRLLLQGAASRRELAEIGERALRRRCGTRSRTTGRKPPVPRCLAASSSACVSPAPWLCDPEVVL